MEKRNYQKEMEKILKSLEAKPPVGLLLHSCCGPCSSYILEYLAPYFRIELLFDNPNIHPFSEYEHRLMEQKRVIAQIEAPHGITLHEGVYVPQRYFDAVKGLEHLGEGSARCFASVSYTHLTLPTTERV